MASDRGIVTEEESWTEYSESLGDEQSMESESDASIDTEEEVIEVNISFHIVPCPSFKNDI